MGLGLYGFITVHKGLLSGFRVYKGQGFGLRVSGFGHKVWDFGWVVIGTDRRTSTAARIEASSLKLLCAVQFRDLNNLIGIRFLGM